jgi:DUF4097 and DUF4098 domain-containing protein YvlB
MSTLHSVPQRRNWKVAGLLPGLLLFGTTSVAAHRLEKHFKVEARPVVSIHNPNGMITIKAWTKPEVMVLASHASADIEVEAEQMGNRVDVFTHQIADSISPDELRADYEISVPENTELQIHNDSGAVSVFNVLGDMNVETVAAGVDLEDAAGYLNVKTVGGSFQCVRCAGRIEVSSISGNFRFIDVRSYWVRAQTSSGNILYNGEFLPNGTYKLKNYSGVIEVRFSPMDSFNLSAFSMKGKVYNEATLTPPAHSHRWPKVGNSFIGSLNLGRAKVELTSFDGTINILKRP